VEEEDKKRREVGLPLKSRAVNIGDLDSYLTSRDSVAHETQGLRRRSPRRSRQRARGGRRSRQTPPDVRVVSLSREIPSISTLKSFARFCENLLENAIKYSCPTAAPSRSPRLRMASASLSVSGMMVRASPNATCRASLSRSFVWIARGRRRPAAKVSVSASRNASWRRTAARLPPRTIPRVARRSW
jgi:hypothetical protein